MACDYVLRKFPKRFLKVGKETILINAVFIAFTNVNNIYIRQ